MINSVLYNFVMDSRILERKDHLIGQFTENKKKIKLEKLQEG